MSRESVVAIQCVNARNLVSGVNLITFGDRLDNYSHLAITCK